jgi:hypothetical protein
MQVCPSHRSLTSERPRRNQRTERYTITSCITEDDDSLFKESFGLVQTYPFAPSRRLLNAFPMPTQDIRESQESSLRECLIVGPIGRSAG